MSSITVISSIIVILAALVCYAFFSQTLNQKKQQKTRIQQAMLARARNFKFMLDGFPKGFLPNELTLLVQRSLADVLGTLKKLDPNNTSYAEDLLAITQQMSESKRAPTAVAHQSASIDNPQQVREVKACLEELYKFIFHLEAKRVIPRAEADTHRSLIKQLVLQLTIDSYVLHGRQAKDKDKHRLALHYFDLAFKLMYRERNSGLFDGRMAQIREVMADLEGKLVSESSAPQQEEPESESNISEEWDQFEKQDSDWKKKQIYD